MKDRNGIEIKTGMIVEITGAYFKTDNGFYFVDNSPGDPTWSGRDYCLHKISKRGKISTAKNHVCFWPISVFVSDRAKSAAAHRWNKEHAAIEVVSIGDMSEVVAHFRDKAENMNGSIRRASWDFGERSDIVKRYEAMKAHYEAVACSI